jgi:hypothetical protein
LRCKTCQYALWNLRARLCPECGSPFAPSEFDFALNSVRFMCPHCAQPYYGTGQRGHLVPPEFDCVKCRRHISMDLMVLLPTEGVREEQTRAEGSPWLERRARGAVGGWFTTIGWGMFKPDRLMRATPIEASTGQAAWFAFLTQAVYIGIGVGVLLLLLLVSAAINPAGGGVFGPAGMGFVLWLLGTFVFLAVLMGLWALAAHGLLIATGDTAAGIGRTAQAICYTSACNALVAIPCAGLYLFPFSLIWWLICATVAAREAQRVSGLRATFAVAGPPLVLLVLMFSGIFWMVASMTAAVTAMQATATQAAAASVIARPMETKVILDALLAWSREHNSAAPDHAARLVLDGRLAPASFAASASGTSADGITFSSASLWTLPGSGAEGEAAVRRAAGLLPPDTIAYRLGDFVFTHPGIDLAAGDPSLWLVIGAPDQTAPGALRVPGLIVPVGQLGGTVTPIAAADFTRALAEQNALRATFGLAPLPDPALLKEGQPATASPPPR